MSQPSFCASCGAPLDGVYSHCPYCGAPITTVVECHIYHDTPPPFQDPNLNQNSNPIPNFQIPPQTIPKAASSTAQVILNCLAVIGLVLGILSVVLCCANLIGVFVGIVGLVFSVCGVKSRRYQGPAIGGIICSICGILKGIVEIVILYLE